MEEITKTILELASKGGLTAVWLYSIYMLGAVLKFVIGFSCLIVSVRMACKTAMNIAERNGNEK